MTGGFTALPLTDTDAEYDPSHSPGGSHAGGGEGPKFKGVSRILGPKWMHFPTLSIGLLGVQIFWSVEMGYAPPYLLSLGLSKSSMAIVFIAGPISGLVMQPLIGVLADHSTSRWGRRRPSMLIGATICALAMLLLGFTREFAAIFTGSNNSANNSLTIWLAVLSIYLIDFSINVVQAMDRALLVDSLPPSAQAQGNAWAARMLGIGSVVGFFVGELDLPKTFPIFGRTQMQVLTVIVSILLLGGHLLMACLVKEKVLIKTSENSRHKKSFIQELRDIWSNMLSLPPIIRQICFIQFFAWIGWFPLLFYTTVYIGDIYKRVTPIPATPEAEIDLDAEATRLGSRALFFSSVLSLFINIIAPGFVSEAVRDNGANNEHLPGATGRGWKQDAGDHGGMFTLRGLKTVKRLFATCRVPKRLQIHIASAWAVSHAIFAVCMFATWLTDSVSGASLLVTITGLSWAITQWAPFSLLAEAILTEPVAGDEPHAIRLSDTRTQTRSRSRKSRSSPSRSQAHLSLHPPLPPNTRRPHSSSNSDDQEREMFLDPTREGDDFQRRHSLGNAGSTFEKDAHGGDWSGDEDDVGGYVKEQRNPIMGNLHAQLSSPNIGSMLEGRPHSGGHDNEDIEEGEFSSEDEDGWGNGSPDLEDNYNADDSVRKGSGLSSKAGIILGIHNIFIVIPQFLVTGLSSIIFALFDPAKSVHPVHNASGAASIPSNMANVGESDVVPPDVAGLATRAIELIRIREAAVEDSGSTSVVFIFRIGGVAATIACVLCWRLARQLRHR